MLTVRLIELGGWPPKDDVVATITFENGKLRVSPPRMKKVLSRKVYLYDEETGKEEFISSDEDPKRWIRNLHREIHGNQFWATTHREDLAPSKQ